MKAQKQYELRAGRSECCAFYLDDTIRASGCASAAPDRLKVLAFAYTLNETLAKARTSRKAGTI